MPLYQRIADAAQRIGPYIRTTPVEFSPSLSQTGVEVFLKLENFQVTGSFKARGATHALLALDEQTRGRGVITASSGNHGAAVAYAAAQLGCDATVFVPEYASRSKVEAIRRRGAEVIFFGDDCVKTEVEARRHAIAVQKAYIPPYNAEEVLHGQGSVGVELVEQLESLDALFIAVGGGGLIGATGAYVKHAFDAVEVVACYPSRSPALHTCIEAGQVVEVVCGPTLSDATAGGVEDGAITLALCADIIDRSVFVEEDAIAAGVREIVEAHGMLVEGAAGLAVAAFRQVAEDYIGKRVAIVLCGANIAPETLVEVLRGDADDTT